jgi:hypothetical protein
MHSSVKASRSTRSSLVTLALAIFVGLGCSGSGSGCSTLTPFAAGTRYSGPKSDNAINIRLSAAGINYLNSNWQSLIGMFAPGNVLTVPVNCTKQSFNLSVIGNTDVYIADQGGNPDGRLDAACNGKDLPANVQVTISGFQLVPVAPDKLQATISLRIATGKIYVLIDSFCNLGCSVDFDSQRAGAARNDIAAEVKFTIDTKWDKLLAFNITQLNGTQICGSSGAPGQPRCIDPGDLAFNSEGSGFCSFACDVLDIGAVKDFVLGLLAPTLQAQVQKAVDGQRCQACMTNADCPVSTDGTNTQSTCDSGTKTCMAGGQCVPRFLGVEGKLNLGGLLGSFGAPANAELQLSVAAGATVAVDQGMSFGTRVGIQPTAVASCVPPQSAPPMTAVAFPDFDGEATPNSGYHVGLGVSSNFLNAAFWSAQQAGALCLNLSSDTVGLVNTGLFKTFLPSLGKLATRDGKDAPMMIVLRPARPPTVVVGEGTYDPVTKKPIKPLLLVQLADVSVDFYAMLDDRQARLFTLTADISLPLSLIFEGCDKVTPALGDLKMLIGNIRTANSEILAEDPQVLADLVPAVIGLAEPALAGALSGFALPALGSFKLKVNEVKGLGRIAGTEAYNHLGLYAQLLPLNAACAVSAPSLAVSLKAARMPKSADMKLTGRRALPWPEAVLDVRTLGKSGSPEYSFRIDNGLWTDFQPASHDELIVSHPRFLLQGQHVIAVRTRVAEDPHALSAPTEIGFLVDWEAPELTLTADPASDRLLVTARDVLSADRLTFAYQVGEGARSDFGAARPISLSAIEAQGGVTVFARDEYGNVGEATYRPPQIALRPDVAQPLPDASLEGRGCSSTGGLELLALGALALLRRRR